ncbi:MAG: hypothetical protein ACSLE1_08160 [Sphingobium sp.]
MSSIVAALRFFFTHTVDRPGLSRKLYKVKHPRTSPSFSVLKRSFGGLMQQRASSTWLLCQLPMVWVCVPLR